MKRYAVLADGAPLVVPPGATPYTLLRHHGDPAKMPRMQPFTCCCGTPMQKEERG